MKHSIAYVDMSAFRYELSRLFGKSAPKTLQPQPTNKELLMSDDVNVESLNIDAVLDNTWATEAAGLGDITADDEFDFTADGIKGQRAVFQVTKATQQRKNEDDVLVVIQYTAADKEVIGFPVTETYWTKHTTPVAQQIGRSGMKALANAVFGQPTGSLSNLLGQYVSMYLKEGKDGRATVTAPQKVTDGALAAVIDETL